VVALVSSFIVLKLMMLNGFSALEENDAQENAVTMARTLDSQAQRLVDFGVTNTEWDTSYRDLQSADREGFSADLPAETVHQRYGIDAVLGVGTDGRIRVGGLVIDKRYQPPTQEWTDPSLLGDIIPPQILPGAEPCGIVGIANTSYLYCSFPSLHADGKGPAAGTYVVLKRLDAATVLAIGHEDDLQLVIVGSGETGTKRRPPLATRVGQMTISSTIQTGTIEIYATLPSRHGNSLTIKLTNDRSISRLATVGMHRFELFIVLGAIVLLASMAWVSKNAVRAAVHPLRKTTEAIMASGDLALRIHPTGSGDIPALGRDIDQMLENLYQQGLQLQVRQAERETSLADGYDQREIMRKETLRISQAEAAQVIGLLVHGLESVSRQGDIVKSAVVTIDGGIDGATSAAHQVTEHAEDASTALSALATNLPAVAEMATLIVEIAQKTRLLSLNATIEAARAGEAGRGFAVVADEVKQLAQHTADSATRISSIVGELNGDATSVHQAFAELESAISCVGGSVTKVQEIAADQSAAIGRLVVQVTEALSQIRSLDTAPDNQDPSDMNADTPSVELF
jgi:methyl-accepting chemotaxis protein